MSNLDMNMYKKCSFYPQFKKYPVNVHLDMETGDPDDYFAFLIVLNNPKFNLVSISVNPGTKGQVGLIKSILRSVRKNIPVGSRKPNHPKQCVRGFWKELPFESKPENPDNLGYEIIKNTIVKYPDVCIITCGPVCNVGDCFRKYPELKLDLWWAQGGFAGDNCVLPQNRLNKFKGKVRCQTYNFNGSKKEVMVLLESKIKQIVCVSKNCCHGVLYNKILHQKVKERLRKRKSLCLQSIHDGMEIYLKKRPEKKFHDPLAVLCVLNSNICEFKSVVLSNDRKKGWGSTLNKNSNLAISVAVDLQQFESTLLSL